MKNSLLFIIVLLSISSCRNVGTDLNDKTINSEKNTKLKEHKNAAMQNHNKHYI